MKHFEIQYLIGHTCFEYKCTTAHEAFDAALDIAHSDPHMYSIMDMDEIMSDIVDMKRGEKVEVQPTSYLYIVYRDGEV